MAEAKDAKRVITLDDIKCNEDNKVMAAVSVIPIIGVVMFFVEKDDLFVRYYSAQYMLFIPVGIAMGILSIIPYIGWFCIAPLMALFNIAVIVLMIIGMVKAYKCERFDIPVISDWAIKLMNAVQ